VEDRELSMGVTIASDNNSWVRVRVRVMVLNATFNTISYKFMTQY
jgi:hypothetical protein